MAWLFTRCSQVLLKGGGGFTPDILLLVHFPSSATVLSLVRSFPHTLEAEKYQKIRLKLRYSKWNYYIYKQIHASVYSTHTVCTVFQHLPH